jgi:hypothetical protein
MHTYFIDKALSDLFCATFKKRLLLENIDVEKLLKVEERDCYDIKTEIWSIRGNDKTEVLAAYNKAGKYIGEPKTAKMLTEKFGIKQIEPANPEGTVCCIGFNPDKETWYGWSHRAICGFGKGDMVYEENFGTDKTPFKKHGRVKIENMEQAKQAAIKFAESVS